MKLKENYTKLTKEILERKKDDISFIFERNIYGTIKTFEELMESVFCASSGASSGASSDFVMKHNIPILVLDDKYYFKNDEIKYKTITKKNILGKNKTVYTDELLYDEIIFINHDLELIISGDIVKTLLLEFLDKKVEEYVLILEEKNKKREEIIKINKEYKKNLLSLK